MAKLIDNNGVQHYATQMLKAENRKVGNKSLPQALVDIDNKLDEMQELFEQEYGSENSNRVNQIKNNIEELSKLRDRITSLEALYDQIALEQARDLALLTNDYENDFMED